MAKTVEIRQQRDHDGKDYLYVTTEEGIEVTVERMDLEPTTGEPEKDATKG